MTARGGVEAPPAPRRVMVWRDRILPGSETFIRNQVDAMASWEPTLVGIWSVDSPIRRDSDVVLFEESLRGRVERRIFLRTGWSPRLDRFLKRRGVSLIHAHFGMGAVSIARTARRLGIPLVVTAHGNDVTRHDLRSTAPDREGRAYARGLTRALTYATTVVAVSRFIAREVSAAYGVPESKVTVLPIGIPVDDVADETATRANVAGSAESDSDVLFVGRLVAKKGVGDLLAAAHLARDRVGALSIRIIGEGKLRAGLEAEARSRGIDATFVGEQAPDEVARAMARATLFVAPSRTAADGDAEGFGMVYLEAARAGLAVVAYDHGGVSEAVEHGVTGLLVPEGDIPRLADAIVTLLKDAGLRAQMGDAARRRLHAEFDIRECTARLECEFDRVLAGRGGARG